MEGRQARTGDSTYIHRRQSHWGGDGTAKVASETREACTLLGQRSAHEQVSVSGVVLWVVRLCPWRSAGIAAHVSGAEQLSERVRNAGSLGFSAGEFPDKQGVAVEVIQK